jgi:hypothetical protein
LREKRKSLEKEKERENHRLSHLLEMTLVVLGVSFNEKSLIIVVVFLKHF